VLENAIGELPPLVATVWLYDPPTTPADKLEVVIASAAATVTLYDCVAVAELASVALMAKVYVPAVVGVPLIVPVEVLSVTPSGNVPVLSVNVTGAAPPLVATLAL
jgi:hypothetical protein